MTAESSDTLEWLVYAPKEQAAAHVQRAGGILGLAGYIGPDVHTVESTEYSSKAVPLGTFSGKFTKTVTVPDEDAHQYSLTSEVSTVIATVTLTGSSESRCTVEVQRGDPNRYSFSYHRGPEFPAAEEAAAWDAFIAAIPRRFQSVGITFDDMHSPTFTGPREQASVAITKPSERSMWSTPVFYARGFDRRDDLCFVLMPYLPELDGFYKSAVQPVVESLGFECQRADNITQGAGNVMEEIWQSLNEARFAIADLTGSNANVFYELGIADTLGKNVIAICQKATSESRLPFDFRVRRVIFYENTAVGAESFKGELRRHIETIVKSNA